MALEKFRKSLKKNYGSESVLTGDEIKPLEILSSFGSLSLDMVAGGGVPRGRIIEMFGPESGGKTLLSLITISKVQENGGVAAFIDLENTADPIWFTKQGVDLSEDKFILLKPESGEDALQMVEDCIVSDEIDLIVLDSIASLKTEAEEEGDFAVGSHMAQTSRLLSLGFKKLVSDMVKHKRATLVLLNQIRSSMEKYKPDDSPGGKALKHACSLRLQIQRVGGADGMLGEKDAPIGFKTRIKLIKSKISPPLRTIITSLYIGPDKFGIDNTEEIVDVAISMDLIKSYSKDKESGELVEDQNGNWYEYNNEKFYGKKKIKNYFLDSEDNTLELLNIINSFMKNKDKPEEDSFNSAIQEQEEKPKRQRKSKKEDVDEDTISED